MAQLATNALQYLHRHSPVFGAERKGFLFEKVLLALKKNVKSGAISCSTEEDQLRI